MAINRTLHDWLAHCEALHPKGINGIELGLERVQAVAERMALHFSCPVITVGGTNGKGSTCAMLEAIYGQAGFKTGVYSSPHLIHFEERCRVAGQLVLAERLLEHFAAVESARQGENLTYFEFTTLAILRYLSLSRLDVVVLEVGMGGRLDAVNIVDSDCAVITNIDLDHMDFLGNTREKIGFEKAGIMRSGKPVVVSDPAAPAVLTQQALEKGADLWQIGRDFHFEGDKQQWAWRASPERGARSYAGMAYPALRGANQLLNASAVLAVITALREALPVTAQAVRTGLALVELPGRFQVLAGQPAVVLDVAHNLHACAVLAHNLDAMGFFPTTHAVFGAMADKDYRAIIEFMRPYIDVWHFCDLPTPRAETAQNLLAAWSMDQDLRASRASSKTVAYSYSNPQEALVQALSTTQSNDRIVVFGSFYTVGAVLADKAWQTRRMH